MNQQPFLRSVRSRARVLGALLGVCGAVQLASAAPPANDTCAGAVVIPAAGAFPYLTPVVTNMNEATLPGDPLPECIGGAARGVWYSFTPSQSGLYSFSTGTDTATTAFDTILSVFAASSCTTVTNEIACNDDSGAANNRAGLDATLVAGTHYFILVWLSQADDESDVPLSLQVRVDRPQPPVNDTCATAEMIPANLGFPRMSAVHDNLRAGTESDVPSCGSGYRSVWFTFTPATTGTYILSTGSETATTVFDTLMVLYNTATDCSALTEVACSANGEGRGNLLRTLNGGTTYYIAIHDAIAEPIVSETMVQLSVATPTAPSVVTLPVVSITSTGAVLGGTINPNGSQTRFWIEWGPTAAYNSTSPVPGKVLFPATTTVVTNLPVTGFLPDATYHYRMVASNPLGRSEGADATFRWSSMRPTLIDPERLSSGNLRFAFIGTSRQFYVVNTSTNLTDWSDLGAAVESPVVPGSFTYTHTGAGSIPRRFYRVTAP